MSSILVVCNSNRIASKMAAAYLAFKLKELGGTDFTVQSAGMAVRRGDAIPQAAVDVLAETGLAVENIGVIQLGLKEIKAADLIICMTADIVKKLTMSYQSAKGKTVLISGMTDKRDIFEPRSNKESCRNCLAMMKTSLDVIAERLV